MTPVRSTVDSAVIRPGALSAECSLPCARRVSPMRATPRITRTGSKDAFFCILGALAAGASSTIRRAIGPRQITG